MTADPEVHLNICCIPQSEEQQPFLCVTVVSLQNVLWEHGESPPETFTRLQLQSRSRGQGSARSLESRISGAKAAFRAQKTAHLHRSNSLFKLIEVEQQQFVGRTLAREASPAVGEQWRFLIWKEGLGREGTDEQFVEIEVVQRGPGGGEALIGRCEVSVRELHLSLHHGRSAEHPLCLSLRDEPPFSSVTLFVSAEGDWQHHDAVQDEIWDKKEEEERLEAIKRWNDKTEALRRQHNLGEGHEEAEEDVFATKDQSPASRRGSVSKSTHGFRRKGSHHGSHHSPKASPR